MGGRLSLSVPKLTEGTTWRGGAGWRPSDPRQRQEATEAKAATPTLALLHTSLVQGRTQGGLPGRGWGVMRPEERLQGSSPGFLLSCGETGSHNPLQC